MRIIQLTVLTVAGLAAAMMFFGRDDGLSADRLGREPEPVATTVLPDPAPPTAEPARRVSAERGHLRIPPARVLTRLSVMEPPLPGSGEAFPLTDRP